MPNLASVLKEEVRRLARKEIRENTGATQRATARARRDIADLKRQVQDLNRRLAFIEKQERRRVGKPAKEMPTDQIRFSPRWLKAHRERLGLSAADYGKLVGVSQLTIYNWEKGVSKPRAAALSSLATVRKLGKREALKRLELLETE